jgi:serine/threonine protein kinase, bacterial
MPLGRGDEFAGYTIVRLLGSGGMGEVYLAEHPRLPRRDALKILPVDVSADEDYRRRFIREADLAASLWHPNIVGVHDRGDHDGQLWISMDFVDGIDAATLLRDSYPGGIPADEVGAIVVGIARALDYAHQRGLLHRDVKPANILLTDPEDGERRILLADFGIVRQIGDISGLTSTNMTVGTLPYAAPEQLMDEPIDGRADQYALAATAYHLLTGSTLFPQSNPAVVISRHLNAAPPTLGDTRPELADLDPVLATALAKDPADRFTRCADFAGGFAAAAQVRGQSAAAAPTMPAPVASRPPRGAPPADRTDTGGQTPRRRRRRTLLGAALGVVLLAAAGTSYWIQSHNSTPKSGSNAAPAAVLDGTYRLIYDMTKQTVNGAPFPGHPDTSTTWWAFRSVCGSTGCMATGTGLDPTNPKTTRTPPLTTVLHFTDGHWQQQLPFREQVSYKSCLGVDGKVVTGADTEMASLSLEPQADGTLKGVRTNTVLTNECGIEGSVAQIPIMATRTGDGPAGVIVADPAGVTAPPPPSRPAPVAAGPTLDGAFRIDLDDADQTVNGHPTAGDLQKETQWWAYRSLCTPTRCVATGARLVDDNPQEPSGTEEGMLQFTDGRWQDTPSIAHNPCNSGNGEQTGTVSIFLQPQPDSTLRGIRTFTVLTNECDRQGNVYKTPVVATRTGDVPPSVVLADPALF